MSPVRATIEAVSAAKAPTDARNPLRPKARRMRVLAAVISSNASGQFAVLGRQRRLHRARRLETDIAARTRRRVKVAPARASYVVLAGRAIGLKPSLVDVASARPIGHNDAMVEPDARPTNAPEITVSELASALKRAIEDRFGYVRVRGEISGYRGRQSSGHAYFSLKDANARLDAVIWRTTLQRMRLKPEEGLEVVATGRLTTFPGKSTYQIVIDSLELAGIGALMALLEARRRKLAEEGLFDAARKRKVPFLPRIVGVVTSPTGAVIRDILHRLADRFPVRVIVWPVRVQGETSAAEVAAAIDGFNAMALDGTAPRPDVLIVARGGGSLEDLMSFNDEAVVRAVARSAIPLIAAVGHETDWTLIDHAADVRAPTPTAAAEFAAPVRAELLAAIAELDARRRGAILRFSSRLRSDLRALARALPGGEAIVAGPRQRLDRAAETLAQRMRGTIDQRALRTAGLARQLARQSPRAHLAGLRERLRG